jgi:hypothetical protein
MYRAMNETDKAEADRSRARSIFEAIGAVRDLARLERID